MSDLRDDDFHFAFGENWKSFLKVLDEDRVVKSQEGLQRLFPQDELVGASFLDIGSGSGLSSLAALRSGVATITSVDVDAESVAATEQLRAAAPRDVAWTVRHRSVFDMTPAADGQFDIVYSWGVLHHTGDMWRAVAAAAALVKPGGLFALALYRKTSMCGFWRVEKRLYSRAPNFLQAIARAVYTTGWYLDEARQGRKPGEQIRNYRTSRGMDFSHDVHDWLGGYPYESATPAEVKAALAPLGFELVREFVEPPHGRWGSGCDEYVFRRA